VGLEPGETSEPVRTTFGYHIIQVTETRTSALDLANRLAEEAREDPDAFDDLAIKYSEHQPTAADGGEVGWVLRYERPADEENVIFGLTEPGEISEVLDTGNGIFIFKLLDTAELRYVSENDRRRVASTSYNRWLTQLKEQAGIWIDPEFQPTTA
jgi:parvulin-like peptidyl-prolyl isomerase